MFGLSVSKILLLALIVGAVVVGTRVLGRIGQEREAARRRAAGTPASPGEAPGESPGAAAGEHRGERPVDLVACEKCGTFFQPGTAVDCGRAGCPYAA